MLGGDDTKKVVQLWPIGELLGIPSGVLERCTEFCNARAGEVKEIQEELEKEGNSPSFKRAAPGSTKPGGGKPGAGKNRRGSSMAGAPAAARNRRGSNDG